MRQNLHDRWKNRRRMAWLALIAGLVFPVLILFTESQELGSVAASFYLFVTGVVGSYIGFATWDDIEINGKSTRFRKPKNSDQGS